MSTENLDTQPDLDLSDLQDIPQEAEVASHLPQPMLVRTAAVAVIGLVGSVIGREFDVNQWVDLGLDIYTVAAPAAVFVWFHRNSKGLLKVIDSLKQFVHVP